MNLHPFDKAVQLQAAPGNEPGFWEGSTSEDYWNMVGPFGGTTAAVALHAVLRHPDLLGEPVALTVNYAAPMNKGSFTVTATPARTSRSTQHWTFALSQIDNKTGKSAVVITGTAMTAVKRNTWEASDMPMPQVLGPNGLNHAHFPIPMPWLLRYDMRFTAGAVPQNWDASHADSSLSQLWIRDEPPRPLDFASLAAMSDMFYPRIWLRRATPVPAGTVSMTIYFHASQSQLTECGDGYLLGQAQAQGYRHGFFDHSGHLWSAGGLLLATTHQLVYYKE